MIEPVINMIYQGGPVLVAIALASVLAWTLIFREWSQLQRRAGPSWTAVGACVADLQAGRPLDESQLDVGDQNFVAGLLRRGLTRWRLDRHGFEALAMPSLRSETIALERPLRLIAVLAAVMPLLGLLGTVMGMIQTFGALTQDGNAQAGSLAGGISQALITTQAGLVVAVPVLLMHVYLNARVQRYLDTASVLLKKIETAVCYDADSEDIPRNRQPR